MHDCDWWQFWGNYLNPRAVQLAEILFQFVIVTPGFDSNWQSGKYHPPPIKFKCRCYPLQSKWSQQCGKWFAISLPIKVALADPACSSYDGPQLNGRAYYCPLHLISTHPQDNMMLCFRKRLSSVLFWKEQPSIFICKIERLKADLRECSLLFLGKSSLEWLRYGSIYFSIPHLIK